MIVLVCEYCLKEYKVIPSRKHKSRCCSRKCLWHVTKSSREPKRILSISNKKAVNNRQTIKNCKICHKEMLVSPSRIEITKFCSSKCYGIAMSSLNKNPHNYIRIYVDGVRVHEHRYIMETYLGRKLTPQEHVHHINHNKIDNRIENLEVLDNSTHSKKHKRDPF
jgi:hypothetical protein